MRKKENCNSDHGACLSERNYPKYLVDLAASIDQPQLPKLIRQFLYQQLNLSDDSDVTSVLLSDRLEFNGHVFVYHSVITQFYALSNLCGVGGMYHRYIHSTPLWQGKYPHCDMSSSPPILSMMDS